LAIYIKGNGKKIAISAAVVAVLMMIGGSLAGGLLGGRWPGYVLTAISCGYAVWLSFLISKKPGKPDRD